MRRLFLASLAALPVLAACSAAPELRSPEARVVFFRSDNAELDNTAREVVADSAAVVRRYPGAPVRVLGYASAEPTSFAGGNLALSRARAESVAGALRSAGVTATRIDVVPVGAVGSGGTPAEGRRVEIQIGG